MVFNQFLWYNWPSHLPEERTVNNCQKKPNNCSFSEGLARLRVYFPMYIPYKPYPNPFQLVVLFPLTYITLRLFLSNHISSIFSENLFNASRANLSRQSAVSEWTSVSWDGQSGLKSARRTRASSLCDVLIGK